MYKDEQDKISKFPLFEKSKDNSKEMMNLSFANPSNSKLYDNSFLSLGVSCDSLDKANSTKINSTLNNTPFNQKKLNNQNLSDFINPTPKYQMEKIAREKLECEIKLLKFC